MRVGCKFERRWGDWKGSEEIVIGGLRKDSIRYIVVESWVIWFLVVMGKIENIINEFVYLERRYLGRGWKY